QRSRKIEFHARERIAANVKTHANRSRRKYLHAAAIVDGELAADIAESRPAGVILRPCKNTAQPNHSVRPDLRKRSLQKKIAVIDKCFAIARNKIRSISQRVLATDDFSVAVSNTKDAERRRIEVAGCGGRLCSGLQRQFPPVLCCAEQCEIGVGVRRNRRQYACQYEKTSKNFHSRKL